MAYNPKLGAMSSPFGENPNAGSIAKENPTKLPPREDQPTVVKGPQDIADMMDEAWGGILDGHNKAQTALTADKGASLKNAIPLSVNDTKKVFSAEAKASILKSFLDAGAEIKHVHDNIIVVSVDGNDVSINPE